MQCHPWPLHARAVVGTPRVPSTYNRRIPRRGSSGLKTPTRHAMPSMAIACQSGRGNAKGSLDLQPSHPATGQQRAEDRCAACTRRLPGKGCPCPESRRVTTSEARMAKRSRHRVSAGRDGRSERPATGRGQPRPTQDVHVHVHSRRHRATDSPTTVHATVAREGLPMPREPACDDKRSQDGRSERPATGRWQPRTTQEFQCHGIRERPATGRGQPRPTQDVHSRPLRRSSPAS